jgi:ribosome recycling factor
MTINDFKQKAQKAIEHFEETLLTVRTGRANPSLVENLDIDAYGSKMPLNQLASISAPEPRMISISVWDKDVVNNIVEAIKKSDLGLNPVVDSTLIRLNIPAMTEERRKELVKVVGKYSEETKVVLRNVRREFMDALKKREKDLKLPENEVKSEESKIDTEIKSFNDQVDKIAGEKEKELMTI